jgi:hypothetical protein
MSSSILVVLIYDKTDDSIYSGLKNANLLNINEKDEPIPDGIHITPIFLDYKTQAIFKSVGIIFDRKPAFLIRTRRPQKVTQYTVIEAKSENSEDMVALVKYILSTYLVDNLNTVSNKTISRNTEGVSKVSTIHAEPHVEVDNDSFDPGLHKLE